MNASEQAAIAHMAQSASTRNPRDLAAQAILIRGATDRAAVQRAILDARASWLDYLTVSQRRWQSQHTRRASRARHHDSLAIREKYVRC